MVRDPDEARDVVQDCFIKAYRSLERFQGDSGFYTWLYRIAVNLCIDRARRHQRAPKVEFDEAVAQEEEGDVGLSPQRLGFDPARALDDREIRERVLAALAQISENHRAILVLREVDGLSYEEIAAVLDIPQGTVMSRLFHARKRMQELLRPLVEDSPGSSANGGAGEAARPGADTARQRPPSGEKDPSKGSSKAVSRAANKAES
jgi:RNA polymerase sigma-70 factor (ECF subfamily)